MTAARGDLAGAAADTSPLDVTVRPATAADLPAIAAVLAANDEPIEWPGLPGWPYLEHVLAHDRLVVAEADGRVVGFAGGIGPRAPDGGTFLSDLFVDPTVHGRGAGKALLGAIFTEPGPRATFASGDPRAMPLYIRFGMQPRWPNLYLVGEAGGLRADGVDIELVEDAGVVSAEFRRLTGQDRSADLAFWLGLPGGTGILASTGGGVVAAGAGRDRRTATGRWLDRMALAPGADPAAVIPAALRALAPRGPVGTAIPGPNPAVRLLVDAGFRLVDSDVFCSTEPPLLDPIRDVADPSLF